MTLPPLIEPVRSKTMPRLTGASSSLKISCGCLSSSTVKALFCNPVTKRPYLFCCHCGCHGFFSLSNLTLLSGARFASRNCRDKGADQGSNFVRSRIQGKVAGIENMNLSPRHILAIAFGFTEIEGQIV